MHKDKCVLFYFSLVIISLINMHWLQVNIEWNNYKYLKQTTIQVKFPYAHQNVAIFCINIVLH